MTTLSRPVPTDEARYVYSRSNDLPDLTTATSPTEHLLRIALKTAGMGYWKLDLPSRTLSASEGCKANFGRAAADDFTYAELVAAIVPDDRSRMREAVERSMTTGCDYDIEYRATTRDGTVRWVQIRGVPLFDAGGKPIGMTGISVDLTNRKREEDDRSTASEAAAIGRSRAATEAGGIGTFDVDLSTQMVTMSPEMCRIFGLDVGAQYVAAVLEAMSLPEDKHLQSNPETRTAGTSELATEYRIRRDGDGAIRWLARKGGFVNDERGKPIRFTGTVSDVTDRKLFEIRQQALIELGDAIRDAESVAEVVSEASRVIGETLGADRVGYALIDERADLFQVHNDWVLEGVASLKGHHALSSFAATLDRLKRGQAVVTSDIAAPNWLRPDAGSYSETGARAQIMVPLLRRGRLVGLLFVHSSKKREWFPEEVDFVKAIADRTYAGVASIRAEEEQELLNQELSHRLKNTLSIVTAIAKQTLRNVSEKDAVEAFFSRVMALSTAHDVLLQESWAAARMRQVVEGVLKLHVRPERLRLTGPDVKLGPKATLSISMLLHEMATNAVKYGALSNENGHVELTWRVARQEGDAEAMLHMEWKEVGGPPAVEPTRKGFGSRLIRAGMSGTGNVELRYGSSGLVANFHAPISLIVEN